MKEATKVFLKKCVRKFIKYCVRGTKNTTKKKQKQKKKHAKELGILPLTYFFTSEFFNKFLGFHVCLKRP